MWFYMQLKIFSMSTEQQNMFLNKIFQMLEFDFFCMDFETNYCEVTQSNDSSRL